MQRDEINLNDLPKVIIETNVDRNKNGKNLPSPDSEYDDTLGVIDTIDITINESDQIININEDNHDGKAIINKKVIPFSAIYAPPVKYKCHKYNIFIPDEDINVKIIDNKRTVTSHPLNPNLYTIEFKHGSFVWTVKKRYKHIQYLHNQLKIFKTSLNIPFPTKTHREKRNTFRKDDINLKSKSTGALPRFPNRPDCLVPYEQLNRRMKELEDYLTNLLQIEMYKRHPETINFLEISHLSFIEDLGDKGKEATVLKRTGSSAMSGLIEQRLNFLRYCCASWHSRHLILKDTFLVYTRPKDGKIKGVILMDNGFEISSGIFSSGLRDGLQIVNSSRNIVIRCWTRRKAKEWLEFINNVANNHGKPFIQENPYRSFAPDRLSTPAAWFIDGSDYMSAVADALEGAKEEIYIADWWLSPEIYMKRPIIDGNYWRLDKILQRKALQGVKVFIMIYKEVEFALGINSYYSKQQLTSLSENIKVFRNPDHARVGVFFWAHHEKIVVVDQTYAFVGGIDLCYGRWDNNDHKLIDLGSVHQSSIYIPTRGKITNSSSKRVKCITEKHTILPLAIATNTIAVSICLPLVPLPDIKTASPEPELKFNDKFQPSSPKELDYPKCNTPDLTKRNLFDRAKNTVDRVKQNVKIKKRELINMVYSPNEISSSSSSSEDEDEVDDAGIQKPVDVEEVLKTNADIMSGLPGAAKLWIGKDYTNFIVKDFYDLEQPYQDLVDRSTTPRMPWHDVGVMVQGAAARDIARHFIQRWNAIKLSKAKVNTTYPFLLPKSYKNCSKYIPFVPQNLIHNVRCQVLRSVSSWSAGFLDSETLEQSIHEAYITAISNAEKYIYIENQFFISLATMDQSVIKNRIAETLFKRILRAHNEGSVFRVFVIMPLLPGFEGEVGGQTGTILHTITHWNYSSISRGKDAILNKLIEAGIDDPSQYITFHGLRNRSHLNGTMVTELIYVHSKLMIVDDKLVICGSANINDRSMIASRDSEIAVIIHDEQFESGKMNSIDYPCGKFAGSLRKKLFREHLGLLWSKEKINIDDPIVDSFYKDIWKLRSKNNTEIYENVFHCIPSDHATDFASLESYQNKLSLCNTDPILAQDLLIKVKGYLVDLPLSFLKQEILTPSSNSVEGILPTAIWT